MTRSIHPPNRSISPLLGNGCFLGLLLAVATLTSCGAGSSANRASKPLARQPTNWHMPNNGASAPHPPGFAGELRVMTGTPRPSHSRATQHMVDYSSCQRVPDYPSSRALRSLLKTIPYTKDRAFHGNYGGSGNLGGYPIDRVDALCRKHDIVYAHSKVVRSMRLADQVFADELSTIDPSTLTPEADEFRRRAIAFMRGNVARFFGKPPGSWFRGSEPHLAGPIAERQLTRFFQVPIGPQETRLLVSMIGKPNPAPDHRAQPATTTQSGIFSRPYSGNK